MPSLSAICLNRLLPWIAKRFELRKIFFIIRHPCAVIASQLKTGWCGYHSNIPPYLDIFPTHQNVLEEASKIEWINQSLTNKLKKIKTQEEILAATWCLDNYIPLCTSKLFPWTVIIYEKIMLDGKKEIKKLFNEIGEEIIPKSAFQNLKEPSMLVLKDDYNIVKDTNEQLSK